MKTSERQVERIKAQRGPGGKCWSTMLKFSELLSSDYANSVRTSGPMLIIKIRSPSFSSTKFSLERLLSTAIMNKVEECHLLGSNLIASIEGQPRFPLLVISDLVCSGQQSKSGLAKEDAELFIYLFISPQPQQRCTKAHEQKVESMIAPLLHRLLLHFLLLPRRPGKKNKKSQRALWHVNPLWLTNC